MSEDPAHEGRSVGYEVRARGRHMAAERLHATKLHLLSEGE